MCTADGGRNTLSRSRFRWRHRSASAVTEIARMTRDRMVQITPWLQKFHQNHFVADCVFPISTYLGPTWKRWARKRLRYSQQNSVCACACARVCMCLYACVRACVRACTLVCVLIKCLCTSLSVCFLITCGVPCVRALHKTEGEKEDKSFLQCTRRIC